MSVSRPSITEMFMRDLWAMMAVEDARVRAIKSDPEPIIVGAELSRKIMEFRPDSFWAPGGIASKRFPASMRPRAARLLAQMVVDLVRAHFGTIGSFEALVDHHFRTHSMTPGGTEELRRSMHDSEKHGETGLAARAELVPGASSVVHPALWAVLHTVPRVARVARQYGIVDPASGTLEDTCSAILRNLLEDHTRFRNTKDHMLILDPFVRVSK